jgi:glutamate N-acetyltransferase/amino-acid N-acetyltransferase
VKLPKGYRYSSAYAGVRKNVDQDDLALVVSESLAEASAVFTQNMVQAAPIRRAKENLRQSGGKAAAVLVNAGNANCATRTGDEVAEISCKALGEILKTKPEYILPASTGVIGVELDPKLIVKALPVLVEDLSPDEAAFEDAARAIMTTDTRMKVASEQVTFRDTIVTVAGMTKGSGMIHPNMATTLGFVMTDAAVSACDLQSMLVHATACSYNSLTVDGDTSTNDMVALLANGATQLRPNNEELKVLEEVITWVMESLAEQIAADGEGARKLIIVRALGFMTDDEAHRVASAVARSPLVKTAVAGSDPNWGRILAAAGYSGVRFDPANVDIHLQRELVCKGGLATDFDEAAMKEKLNSPEVRIRVTLNGPGKSQARFFTCDLTERYIEINGSYRT